MRTHRRRGGAPGGRRRARAAASSRRTRHFSGLTTAASETRSGGAASAAERHRRPRVDPPALPVSDGPSTDDSARTVMAEWTKSVAANIRPAAAARLGRGPRRMRRPGTRQAYDKAARARPHARPGRDGAHDVHRGIPWRDGAATSPTRVVRGVNPASSDVGVFH